VSPRSSVMLEQLTWPEIREALAAGARTAIIVAAATEQHGPHLPLATDSLIGEALAQRLAVQLGDALVAPVIRIGCSDHHMAFPGTISATPGLLTQIIQTYISSLQQHGFTKFVVFSSHGGNFHVLDEWARTIDRARIVVVGELEPFIATMLAPLSEFARRDATMPHADVSETSEMLAVCPTLVHLDRAEAGFIGNLSHAELRKHGLAAVSANGVLGEPRGSSAEIGEAVISALVTHLARVVRASPAYSAVK
jgi:creatinine amidohydrolase